MPQPESRLSISAAARLAGMHVNTLRKYERHGFIAPARTAGNQRLFTEKDIARLGHIKRLVDDRGVNLAGVEIAMAVADLVWALREACERRTDARVTELRRALDEILLALMATVGDECRPEDSLEDMDD